MSRYDRLKEYLRQRAGQRIAITFAEIEEVLGRPLPASARRHRAWWSNNPTNNVMTNAWLEAGYRTADVDMAGEKLVFERVMDEQSENVFASASVPPLHGFMRGTLRLPPEAELTRPAEPDWQHGDGMHDEEPEHEHAG